MFDVLKYVTETAAAYDTEPRSAFRGGQLVQPGPGRQGYADNKKTILYEFPEDAKFTKKRVRPGVGGDPGFDYFVDGQKVSRTTWAKHQDPKYLKSMTKQSITKRWPGIEKRAIELLNQNLPVDEVANTLESEGIIKLPVVQREKGRAGTRKLYSTFTRYFNKLLDEGKLKIKKISTVSPTMTKRDDAIVKAFKENPDLTADRLAKRLSAELNTTINPIVVKSALKRRGIDYEGKAQKIFKEVKALDEIVKNNRALIGGNKSATVKQKELLQLFKDAMKNQKITPETFTYRLNRLGKLYAGTAEDRTADKIYKSIKAPKNYIDSGLQKGIIQVADREFLGVLEKAKLLGLPKKEIELLEDIYSGVGHLAGKIKMAGDHTDISAMMKDFPNYKKNFTRINMITDELNQMKLKYDNRILKHYKDLKAFQGKVGPDILAKRADLLGKIAMEKKNWFKQTGLNIGEPKFNKQGKMFMDFTTERLSDIDSPRNTTLKNTMEHLMDQKGIKFTNVVDQEVLKGGSLKSIFNKFKGTKEIANSKFVQSLSKMGGKYGKLTAKLIGGTIGAGGIITLATAGTTREKGLTTEEMKGRKSEMSMVPEVIAQNPWTSAAVGTGAALTQKPVRSLLGKTFRTLGTPIAGPAFAAWTASDKMKAGESLADAVIDPLTGAELALPTMFKENLSKIAKSPTARKILGLGKFGTRFLGPIGWGIAGVGAVRDAYKDYQRRKPFIEQMRADPNYIEPEYDTNFEMYAGGGMAGIRRPWAIPPDSGPMPQGGGLSSQFNRVRKLTG